MKLFSFFLKQLPRGGVILAGGAVLGKALGLLRDRLLVGAFSPEQVDLTLAAFRIPDFFYFLLISGTVSTLLLPRLSGVNKDQHDRLFSSFLWLCAGGMALVAGLGVLFAEPVISGVFAGYDETIHMQMLPVMRVLFGATFLMSISAVFAAFLQHQERFVPLALGPVLFTSSIIGALVAVPHWGPTAVAWGALAGAGLHLLLTSVLVLGSGVRLRAVWKSPSANFVGFWPDVRDRVLSSSVVQLLHLADASIASFLRVGALTAFSYGSALGHLLLTILGLSFANGVFPKLAKNKHDYASQSYIIRTTRTQILFVSIPASVLLFALAPWVVSVLFGLEAERLFWTVWVLRWTVVSLPAACLIPLYSRAFLANDDTRTPLVISAIASAVSLSVAGLLALVILPPELAVIGLGVGNFITNWGIFLGLYTAWKRTA